MCWSRVVFTTSSVPSLNRRRTKPSLSVDTTMADRPTPDAASVASVRRRQGSPTAIRTCTPEIHHAHRLRCAWYSASSAAVGSRSSSNLTTLVFSRLPSRSRTRNARFPDSAADSTTSPTTLPWVCCARPWPGNTIPGSSTGPRVAAIAPTCPAQRLLIESRWVSKPLAFAGKLRTRRLNK
jgi:hypothetical protein